MRTYDVAIASLAIDAPAKWTDNVLSHHDIPGVVAHQRGIARKIPHHAIVALAVVRELHLHVGISVRDALAMAPALLADDSLGVHTRGHVRVTLDRHALERDVDARLRDALESAPSPRRGRPPARRPATR